MSADDYERGANAATTCFMLLVLDAPRAARVVPIAVRMTSGGLRCVVSITGDLSDMLAHFDESPTMSNVDEEGLRLSWAHPCGEFVTHATHEDMAAAGLLVAA